MKKVAVVAPTFNEEESVKNFLDAVLAEQKNLSGYQLELVIADSHSKDKTQSIVKAVQKKNKHLHLIDSRPGPGKLGLGLTEGIDFAVNKIKANYIVTMEADLTENPDLIPQFVSDLETHDVVIGSRYAKGGKIMNWTWWRKGFSLCANFILGLLAFNFSVHEYTNLYRAFRSNVWEKIRPKVALHVGWLFVPAFAFEVISRNFKIIEEPFTYYDRFGGRSKMNTLSYTKNLLRYALAFRIKKIFGK